MAEWEVELSVLGAITVDQPMVLDVIKGRLEPFWTSVKIDKSSRTLSGVTIQVVVRASEKEEANDAAIYFVGQTLDLLSLRTDLATSVTLRNTRSASSQTLGNMIHNNQKRFQSLSALNSGTRRRVEQQEWDEAFRLGRKYGIDHSAFSRAISWYRKGLTSEDPIDKLIAFWSALEGIGVNYARKTPRTKKGAVNQICDCFEQLWGEDVKKWAVIGEDIKWVNRFHDKRNGIAHGFIPVNIETIRDITSQLPKLKQLSHQFLLEWEGRLIHTR